MENKTHIEVSSILKVLAYYDVFDYPLTSDEVFRFTKHLSKEKVRTYLNKLVKDSTLFKIKNFYSLKNDLEIVKNRIEGNVRANEFLKKAIRRAKLIAKFPYVRAVLISGSFSKGYMPSDGDVDYFVITKNNRLWLARTLIILYKKVFLFNSRKFFCVNYFIGEKNLEIEQKNIFTATELYTLSPIINYELYKDLIKKNNWIEEYYDLEKIKNRQLFNLNRSLFQSLAEPIFNNKLGEKIDLFLMKLTLKRWERKFPELPKVDFKIAFKSTRNVSKHHPSNFQKKVLESYTQKLNKLNHV